MEAERAISSPAADGMRVIALTGARRGEIAGLRCKHVDLQKGRILLPPLSHKAGKRTGKPREITLPTVAQAIIARRLGDDPEAFVFPPASGGRPIALSKPWLKVRVSADLPKGIGLHGLRHSVASHMAMQGSQAAEIMKALGHRQLSTTARYIHFAENARQALAERAAAVALAGLAASTGTPSGQIVPLKGKS